MNEYEVKNDLCVPAGRRGGRGGRPRRRRVVECGHRPAVRIDVAWLRIGEVGGCEAFDGLAGELLGEQRQREQQQEDDGALAMNLVHTIVDGFFAADKYVADVKKERHFICPFN